MRLGASDFMMTRFAHAASGMLKALGDVETDVLGDRLASDPIDRPVFIAGLARAGTTILLELFSRLPNVATHRYRDFPFLFVPYWWSRYQDLFSRVQAPVERPHKDRIVITKDSPEAFEEPIWAHFFPFVHQPGELHRIGCEQENLEFDGFYRDHLRKIMLLRGAQRYVSKGNYNVARIEYLARLFPEARFIIPVRHPLTHVHSLVRQHELFSGYDRDDSRVSQYLRAAGHFEFGPQRVPINLDKVSRKRIQEAWRDGQDALGYAIMWQSVYRHLHELSRGPLSPRIALVKYEDFCVSPRTVLKGLFEFCEFEEGVEGLLDALPPISSPGGRESAFDADDLWNETRTVASELGYERQA